MHKKNNRVEGLGGREQRLVLWASMATVSLALSSAMAQDATNDDGQSYYSTNKPAWLNPAEPLSLSYGSFDLHPRLRVNEIYDDNIDFTQTHREKDLNSEVAPGVQILGGDRQSLQTQISQYREWNLPFSLEKLLPSWLVIQPSETWPDKFLLVDYSPQWQEYARYSANDSLDHFLTANGVWPMAKLAIGVQENYTDQKTTIIEANSHSEIIQNHSEIDGGYRLNDKFSVDTAFDRQEVSYPGSTNLAGYTEWKGSVSVNRQINALLNTSLVLAGGEDDVEDSPSQQFVQFGGRVRYLYSALFTVDGSAGAEYRQFNTGRSSTVTPFFSLGVGYQPWERTYFGAGVARRQVASLYNGFYYTSTGGYLTLHKDITDRFSVWTDLNYYYFDYTPIANVPNTSQPSDYYSIRLSGSMKIWTYLNGQLYYQFSGNGLLQNNNVVQDNQVGLSMELRF